MNKKIDVQNLNLWYGDSQALRSISLEVPENSVMALIGPSGCGKSTFLRCLNRMNDLIPSVRIEGSVVIDGQNVYDKEQDIVALRTKVGMVFQKSTPFPKSIFENIAYGLRVAGESDKQKIEETVVTSLQNAALWEEVKDRLDDSAMSLSGGQQQRLCIARTLAVSPDVILMDEPASALDPIATEKIENLIHELKAKYTIVIVTHNMQQAARVSDWTAFFYLGELVEADRTKILFTTPSKKQTEDYITGKFG